MHPAKRVNSHVSTPIKRIRWATQRAPGHSGRRKRDRIIDRLHKRPLSSSAKKRESNWTDSLDGSSPGHDGVEPSDEGVDQAQEQRRIFFNVPLPPEAKDANGYPIAKFERNKVRTAKYTPISFVPKNLWFQFQNVANVYFLFILILSVSTMMHHIHCIARLTDVLVLSHLRCFKSRSSFSPTHRDHLRHRGERRD